MHVHLPYRHPGPPGVSPAPAPVQTASRRARFAHRAAFGFAAGVALLGAVAGALGIGVRTAHGDSTICAERTHVLEQLAGKFGEIPVMRGLRVDGRMMEVYASSGGTWTIAFTRPDGHTCVTASGEALDLIGVPGFAATPDVGGTAAPSGTL